MGSTRARFTNSRMAITEAQDTLLDRMCEALESPRAPSAFQDALHYLAEAVESAKATLDELRTMVAA